MLNYGLGLASNGDWEVIETSYEPGVKDEFTLTRNGTFTLFVAPSAFVDRHLLLQDSHPKYESIRKHIVGTRPGAIKDAILKYFF